MSALGTSSRLQVAATVTMTLVVGCAADSWHQGTRGRAAHEETPPSPSTSNRSTGARPIVGPAAQRPASTVPGGLTARDLGAFSPSTGRVLSCDDSAARLPDRAVVYCPANCRGSQSLWGTRIYTSDSSVCAAALHDGVLGDAGGYAVVVRRPGQAAYAGSQAHGISSAGFGAFSSSFEVFAVSGVETFPMQLGCHHDGTSVLDSFPPEAVLSCATSCPRSTVYGDGFYTVDSSVCGAAQHMGVPLDQFVIRTAGQRSDFDGRWRHGIRSSSWSSAWNAFTVHPWAPASAP